MRAFDELIEWAESHQAEFQTEQVEGRRLTVENGALRTQTTALLLDKPAMDRLCFGVGAPASYLRRIEPPMREALLNRHLSRGDHLSHGRSSTVVLSHRGRFLGFTRADLALAPVGEVMRAVGAGIGSKADDVAVHRKMLNSTDVQIELVSARLVSEVSPGDIVQAGLSIRHSALGAYATSIESFILRLVCKNGLTHRECVRRGEISRTRRLPSANDNAVNLQLDQVRRLAAETWDRLGDKLSAMERLQKEPVNVEQLLRQYLTRARMSSRELMKSLLAAWREDRAQETAFGALNALTRVATHGNSISARQQRMLSRLAGILATSQSHICPRCFTVIQAS